MDSKTIDNGEKKALVTGSMGLVGLESVNFFLKKGFKVIGIDNDMRKYFFGEESSTSENKKNIDEKYIDNYIHYDVDIRKQEDIEKIFIEHKFNIIIHTAAQPSHDWAAKEPLVDFSVNAFATLILLENFRKHCPEATFIFTSTNKVYGDTPNFLPLVEKETRYEIDENHQFFKEGIDESMSIDNSKHSLFGISKLSADTMVQEYGKYFGLNTGIFRCGCITGGNHSGAEMHGFLSYLTKCIATGKKYYIFGYKGKQVRDNIHAYDLVNMFWSFHKNPKQGEVYNAGGSRFSNISMIEAIKKSEKILGKKANYEYKDGNRSGDHIWYVSDISKFKKDYPDWNYKYSIDDILENLCLKYKR